MRYKAPKGTHDVLPAQSHRWRALEAAFADVARLYGYLEIRTPAFEETELFVRSSGDTSDIVTKQMYTFLDKKGRSLSLKPECTAPAIRAYLEHGLGQSGSITRLCYASQIFRYEQPQKGRYRQSHQVGIELIGSSSPLADGEVIELAVRFYERLGLRDVSVLVNTIGRRAGRERYGEALLSFLEPYLRSQDASFRERAHKNPLRLVDSKDPELQEKLVEAPRIGDYLEADSKERFEAVLEALEAAGVHAIPSPEIVRGLDYYTDIVFEVHSTSLGSQSALCGGGRYDDLIEQMGGPITPSVGFGAGIERALIAQEAEVAALPQPGVDAYLVAATSSAHEYLATLARNLRAAGISALMDYEGRPMKSQLRQADRSGARYAVIVGDDEILAGSVTLRSLSDSTQRRIQQDAIIDTLRTE